ncbi:hypothetical protein TNIN_498661 [Trichonephila inaurata madagascariensis]|uniref:Uncharacterized protein n=1 Tax=Trichonephila inaurata madagascariensis TaxID=2747483 RepID=A0A8X6XJE9_9ARAC|nr:hypothetical protein TNIN_498661 [Trichonephila inaurata madagascariensis]
MGQNKIAASLLPKPAGLHVRGHAVTPPSHSARLIMEPSSVTEKSALGPSLIDFVCIRSAYQPTLRKSSCTFEEATNLSESWKHWKEDFENYLEALRYSEEPVKTKSALFRHLCEEELKKTATSFRP